MRVSRRFGDAFLRCARGGRRIGRGGGERGAHLVKTPLGKERHRLLDGDAGGLAVAVKLEGAQALRGLLERALVLRVVSRGVARAVGRRGERQDHRDDQSGEDPARDKEVAQRVRRDEVVARRRLAARAGGFVRRGGVCRFVGRVRLDAVDHGVVLGVGEGPVLALLLVELALTLGFKLLFEEVVALLLGARVLVGPQRLGLLLRVARVVARVEVAEVAVWGVLTGVRALGLAVVGVFGVSHAQQLLRVRVVASGRSPAGSNGL